jgi:tetratricopeptide (TPR) repeat protein
MFDPRAAERTMHDLTRLIDAQGFETPEEVESYARGLLERGEIPRYEPQTDLERAQEKMYDAWSAKRQRRRVRLAKDALKICPDCADAYVLLGEEACSSLQEAADMYRAGVAAGERALGPAGFERYAGDFWGEMSTRPYMRALYDLALTEGELGNHDEAEALLRRMLELNPNDNQGARYNLLTLLLVKKNTPAVHILLRQYQDDPSASWSYGRALAIFLERGNTRHARSKLQEALYQNIWFPSYLLGAVPLPEEQPPYIELGTASEGLDIFYTQASAWLAHERSLEWLADIIGRTPPPDSFGRY